jgi:hypothetical protein
MRGSFTREELPQYSILTTTIHHVIKFPESSLAPFVAYDPVADHIHSHFFMA